MNSNTLKIVFAGFAIAANAALAADVAPAAKPAIAPPPAKAVTAMASPAAIASFGELDALRSQNAILAEKVKAAEMQAKLAGANPIKAPSSSLPPFPTTHQSGPAPQFDGFSQQSAQVQMVSDTGNNRIAVISLPNGARVSARVGSTIPNLGVVQSISLNEVVVANKKQTISVPFASEPANASGGGANAFPPPASFPMNSMPMPPLPMRGSR